MPTLRQLQALSLIAQTGSFTQAAGRLFITQSAVSALIRELESEVGQPLIVRGRSLRLTAAGERIEQAGHRAHREVERALQEVRGDRGWTQEVVRLACGSLSAATLVPPALVQLAREQRGVRVVLIDRPVAMVGDLLLSGEADVAVGWADVRARGSSELKADLLLSDTLCAVAARGNGTLAVSGRAGWAALKDAELILVGRVGGQWNSLLQEQIALHPGMKVGYEVQLYSTALELVRQGLGVAVLPRFAAQRLDRAAFAVQPLQTPGTRWSTYWITRKGADGSSPAFAALHKALKKVVATRPFPAQPSTD